MKLSFLQFEFNLEFLKPAIVSANPLFFLRGMLGKNLRSMCCISRQSDLQILFQNPNSLFHALSEYFLHFLELVFFVQVVKDFAVGFFSVPTDEDCLCLACGGSVVTWRVESFLAFFEFRAVKAAVKIFFFAAFYVRACSAGKHRAERAAVEYRAAATAPFAQKAVSARKSADCRHVNALFCRLHDLGFPASAVFQAFLFFFTVC